MDKLRTVLREGIARFCPDLNSEQEEKILHFIQLLHKTNKECNLTGFKTEEEILVEGVLDSLAALVFQEILRKSQNLIDVGTGGGIPGIPLKIVSPWLRLTLLEATEKKCRFLKEAVQALSLEDTQVLCGRAEVLAHEPALRETYDLATARALGELREILELTTPFLRPGGFALFYKGPGVAQELGKATNALHVLRCTVIEVREVPIPFLSRQTTFVLVRKEGSTPPRYPRRPGIPKKRPL